MTKSGHRRRGLTVEPKSIRLGVFSLAPAARNLAWRHCRIPDIVAGLLIILWGRIISNAQNNRGRNAMIALSRRNVLAFAGGIAAAALAQRADAAIGPNDKFDLVIKGGDVLDPSQSLRGKRDVGIRWGVVEAVDEAIPVERAAKTIDASGKLVTPGLVDLHCHVYPYGSAIGIPADELVQFQGTTTVVSAGDAGVNNLAALRRFIVAQTRARMYAFLHIANNGLSAFPVAELYNIDNAQVEACAMALAENPDFLIGVKVRMSENVIFKHGIEPLKRGIQACEMCGWPARMMVHIGGVETRELMSDILDLLRPGDVLTHCYSGAPNMSGVFTNIVQDGRLLPAALAAKQRGVIFDVAHGGGSFDFTVAEVAIPGGCAPDTISSDIHVFSGNTPGMPFLPNVMSKFLAMGFPLEQVVAMTTIAPAKIINRAPKIGTLQVGAPGDVTIMDLVEGPVTFVDTRNNKRNGKLLLKPVQTVINGVPFGRPYQSPFAVR
jgi:dihydroorotase